MRRAIVAIAIAACGGTAPPSSSAPEQERTPGEDDAAGFDRELEGFYQAHLAFRPDFAMGLGHHEFDGRVADRSPDAVEAEIGRLRAALSTFETLGEQADAADELDRQIVIAEIRKELFSLVELRRHETDPFYYLFGGYSLSAYVDRDYAPVETRARALLRACEGGPEYFRQMRANLGADTPAPRLQVGVYIAAGTRQTIDGYVREQMKTLPDDALEKQIGACLDRLTAAIGELEADLKGRIPGAPTDFALGPERFLAMLRETQGIAADLETLRRVAREDLDRNLAALREAAAAIDPEADVAAVIARAAADKPDPAHVLKEATAQVEELRAFLLEKNIVSIPGNETVVVRPSPPHRRGNMASFSGVGPFEAPGQPSFYYITPPDPSWPEKEQRDYVKSRADLWFLSAHEVWPGHFLQGRHIQHRGSRMVQSFETYTTSEGWAHYTEEMMWDAGLGAGDPAMRIGMLKNALLRNVRFVVALGLHTEGMTLEEATGLFVTAAHADPATARQQAMRGTGDPMYLSYTLGKLIIRKLQRDWSAQEGEGATLRAFHDELLGYGEAPLPVIRAAMLGEPGQLF